MNSEFILQQAGYLASRVRKEAAGDPTRQAQVAWQLALARPPEPAELERALAFMAEQSSGAPVAAGAVAGAAGAQPAAAPSAEAPVDPLASLCQVLLSSNEFLYVD
jgi:hypothetical protein